MLRDRIEKELMKAVRILPPDCEALIRKAYEREENVYARKVLSHIIENIRIAGEGKLPLCQDCGMFYCYVTLAENCRIPLSILENEINLGCAGAAQKAFYRRSVVDDPVYDRNNTYIELTIPLTNGNSDQIEGVMLVSTSTIEIQDTIGRMEHRGNLLMLIISMLVIFFSFIVSKILVKPFSRVSKAIEELTDGYLDEEISVTDYTETEMITNVFNKLLKRMKILDDSRQEFVANVSHELKTPMTSIKVLADSLAGQEDVPVELYKEFMQDITVEIDRENKIITDLLALVKMDRKASDLNIQKVSINELLENILKRLKPIADKKKVELVLESYRPVVAEIDEVKLSLAFSNLVENGIKYNIEEGWVHVTLNADHKYFYVTVSDSGMGIPEESIDKIFERFYRVDKSHSREIGGTGLGLAITRNAIVMHRGAIKVKSKEHQGTTFSVRIPLNYIA